MKGRCQTHPGRSFIENVPYPVCVCICVFVCVCVCVCVWWYAILFRDTFMLSFWMNKTILMVVYATILQAIICLWLQRNSPVTKKYHVPLGFVRKVFNCSIKEPTLIIHEGRVPITLESILAECYCICLTVFRSLYLNAHLSLNIHCKYGLIIGKSRIM